MVPVYGKYRISDFINYFGINFNKINENRVLIQNLNRIQKQISLTDEILSEKNQSVTVFEERQFNLIGPAKISGKLPIKRT